MDKKDRRRVWHNPLSFLVQNKSWRSDPGSQGADSGVTRRFSFIKIVPSVLTPFRQPASSDILDWSAPGLSLCHLFPRVIPRRYVCSLQVQHGLLGTDVPIFLSLC